MSIDASAVRHTEDRVGAWSRVRVDERDYLRLPVRTRWLTTADELVLSLKESLGVAQLGDTVAVSEKLVVLLTGRALDIETMRPGWLARRLAGHVRCRTDSKGLSVPEKMEYVIRTIGSKRVVTAAIAGAVTRPLGIRGTFYRLAGSVARDIDGGRPPYEHLLFPPLDPSVAQQICLDLERALGIGVSIVDLNDFPLPPSPQSSPTTQWASAYGVPHSSSSERPNLTQRFACRRRSTPPERQDLHCLGQEPAFRRAQ